MLFVSLPNLTQIMTFGDDVACLFHPFAKVIVTSHDVTEFQVVSNVNLPQIDSKIDRSLEVTYIKRSWPS